MSQDAEQMMRYIIVFAPARGGAPPLQSAFAHQTATGREVQSSKAWKTSGFVWGIMPRRQGATNQHTRGSPAPAVLVVFE